MFINQHQQDELELALSCTDYYQRPVVQKVEPKKQRSNGFTREDIIELAKEMYTTEDHQRIREQFFRERNTSYAEFVRAFRNMKIEEKRFFRIDGGKIYRMTWSPWGKGKNEKFRPMGRGKRRYAFTKEYSDNRELFVELAHCYYSHFYNDPKGFQEVLDTVDISRPWYKKKFKRYNIQVEFFMSLDDGEIFPLKCRTPKYK
ncbi:hypothetical protein IIF97_001267 [Salmonella enterica]|nr:hypothetical protein [Salmonella enterica]